MKFVGKVLRFAATELAETFARQVGSRVGRAVGEALGEKIHARKDEPYAAGSKAEEKPKRKRKPVAVDYLD